jgi:NAD(P)-dependent dehydrogenase (short-subunit alcohol dehydrogenase family)
MKHSLEGRVAIVTGAGGGLGREHALFLARWGARVLVNDVAAAAAEAVAAEIRAAGGMAMPVAGSVTDEAAVASMVERAVEEWERLDILVNNAGIFPRATLEETTEELWDEIMAVNLKAVFFLCKHAVPAMRATGGGSIVNIGSINGYIGGGNLFAYSISKGGLLTLTRNLARSLAREKIRVNYLNPGWVITPGEIRIQGLEGLDRDWLEARGREMPLGRLQTPTDAAYGVLYLASDESAMVTGVALNVDGGSTMR